MIDKTTVRGLIAVALLFSVFPVARGQGIILDYTTPGIQSVTLPACTATIQCWGAGGTGGSAGGWQPWGTPGSVLTGGGGGGGGGYSQWSGTLSAGTWYFQVGTGGGSQGTSNGEGVGTVGTADTVWDWDGSTGGQEAWAVGGSNGGTGSSTSSGLGGANGYDAYWIANLDSSIIGGMGGIGAESGGNGGGGGGSAGPGIAGSSGGIGYNTNGSGGAGYAGGGCGGGLQASVLPYLVEPGNFPGGGGGGAGVSWYQYWQGGYPGYYSQTPGAGANGEIVVTYAPLPTPEPSTLALLLAGAVGVLAFAWQKRMQAT